MKCFVQCLSLVVATVCLYSSCCGTESENEVEDEGEDVVWPTIGVSILVKNKEHTLPFALTCLENLDYPKDRQYIWFYIDEGVDGSVEIIDTWSKKYKNQYNKIYVHAEKQREKPALSRENDSQWTEERLKHVIKLREKALSFAKKQWADYLFMLDADVFLIHPKTLKKLIKKKAPIVAPMLISDGLYSNFWDDMSESYHYEKTDRYEQIANREIVGCFEVPMVHSAVLVDLRAKKSARLTYDPANLKVYKGPIDDIIVFAVSASDNGIAMQVCNDEIYGFVPVPVDMNHSSIKTNETEQLLNVKMEAMSLGVEFPVDEDLRKFVKRPPKDRLGLDQVFMINLERRFQRRRLMQLSFDELGIEATIVKAVDGLSLDMDHLSKYGVTLMPNYEDPFHKRPMKAGEVGCFLSHYSVWKEIAKRQIGRALVLEDDIHFMPFFRRRLTEILRDLDAIEWDVVYIGRKILLEGEEYVTPRLSRPFYSYWTLGYLVSEAGARKLIQAEPLAKMLPVDEFLPIMFDQHPNDTWKSFFPRRELKALSAAPLLVTPTHYTGQPGYVSDTEDSHVLTEVFDDGRKSSKTL